MSMELEEFSAWGSYGGPCPVVLRWNREPTAICRHFQVGEVPACSGLEPFPARLHFAAAPLDW